MIGMLNQQRAPGKRRMGLPLSGVHKGHFALGPCKCEMDAIIRWLEWTATIVADIGGKLTCLASLRQCHEISLVWHYIAGQDFPEHIR